MSQTSTSSLAPTTARPVVEDFVEKSEISSAIQRALDVLEQTCPNVLECSNFLHQSGHVLHGTFSNLQIGLDHRVSLRKKSRESRSFSYFAIDCGRAVPRVPAKRLPAIPQCTSAPPEHGEAAMSS
jgi:hypothetical protein